MIQCVPDRFRPVGQFKCFDAHETAAKDRTYRKQPHYLVDCKSLDKAVMSFARLTGRRKLKFKMKRNTKESYRMLIMNGRTVVGMIEGVR